jgi:hypothetical protein
MDIMSQIREDAVQLLDKRMAYVIEKIQLLLSRNEKDVKDIIRALLTYEDFAIYASFGCQVDEGISIVDGHIPMWDPIAYMEWVSRLIGYEILRGGDIALGYQRYDAGISNWVCCAKDAEGAEPILLPSIFSEVSQEYRYKVVRLTDIMPILDFHRASYIKTCESTREWYAEDGEVEEDVVEDPKAKMRLDLAKYFGLVE